MATTRIARTRARKRWIPLDGFRWPPPRLVQLLHIAACFVIGHDWGQWRVETEDWYEEVAGPEPWAWRLCHACSRIENCVEVPG